MPDLLYSHSEAPVVMRQVDSYPYNFGWAETFTPTEDCTVESISFYLKEEAGLTGDDIIVWLLEVDESFAVTDYKGYYVPSDEDITTSEAWVNCPLVEFTSLELTAGHTYAVAIENDTSDYALYIGYRYADSYAGDCYLSSDSFVSGTEQPGQDLWFRVYGTVTEPPTGPEPVVDTTTLDKLKVSGNVTGCFPVYYYTSGRPSDGAGEWSRMDTINGIDRLISIDPWVEEPYNAEATVSLDNSDGIFNSYDTRGLWVRIGRGFNFKVNYHGYYKVIAHWWTTDSDSGKSTYNMYCVGGYNLLQRYLIANPDDITYTYYFNRADLDGDLDGYTIRDIVEFFCALAGVDLGTDISLDSYVDVLTPKIAFGSGMSAMQAIMQVLAFTQCSIIPVADEMIMLYLNTGNSRSYECPMHGTYQPFLSGVLQELLYTPMKVTVVSAERGADGVSPKYSGSYTDTDNYDSSMGEVYWEDPYGMVTGASAAAAIAIAEVKRAQSQVASGEFSFQIGDPNANIYDAVTIYDSMGNTSGTGVIGGIYMHLNKLDNNNMIWTQEIRLGGLTKSSNSNVQSMIDEMNIGLTSRKLPGNSMMAYSMLTNSIAMGVQGYTIEGGFYSADYHTVSWENVGGAAIADVDPIVIYFNDGTSLAMNNTGSPKTISGTQIAYFIQGQQTIKWTTDIADTYGPDRGIIAIITEGDSTNDISCGIRMPYGKDDIIIAGQIVCDYISAINADLGTILAGTIIFIDNNTNWNSWSDPDTATGIVIGYDSVNDIGRFEAYNAGQRTVYIGSDGAFYTDGQAIKITENGIEIKDVNDDTTGWLKFIDNDDNTSLYFYMDTSLGQAYMVTDNDYDLIIMSDAGLFLSGTDGVFLGQTTFSYKCIFDDLNAVISSGVMAASKSMHNVVGEGTPAANDDLVTITDGVDGEVLILRAEDDSVTITVKDISVGGAANLQLAGGNDFVMDSAYDRIVLQYFSGGARWVEISRSKNA